MQLRVKLGKQAFQGADRTEGRVPGRRHREPKGNDDVDWFTERIQAKRSTILLTD